MGRVPDDGDAAAADYRRTMLTPTVTEIRRGSAHGGSAVRPNREQLTDADPTSDTTMTALLLTIKNALTLPVFDPGYELVQIGECERQAITDVLGRGR
jgi:hypothetical protein